MAVLRIQDFSGQVPILGDRALPDNFAVAALNTDLYSKELRGVNQPVELSAIGTAQKVLRIPRRTFGGNPAFPTSIPAPSYLGDSVWVPFFDKDTDIVRGQLVNDSFERWYFCSPGYGPQFNTYARMLVGDPPYRLGVPSPNQSPIFSPTIVSIVGGGVPVVTRAFVYTWVNIYGEESAPSLPVVGSGNANAVWNIGNISDPVFIGPYAPAAHKVLYRTVTGASGQTAYYKVAEIAIGVTTYADDGAVMTDAIIVDNLVLESVGWDTPPINLEGFIAMPNGYLIGFRKSNIYFSESYRFHAWPSAYVQASEYNVVGLGVVGQTCVVCTEGFPATVTGAKPGIASFTKATTGEPAMSRGSIVSTPNGVLYASQNGLVLVGPGGIDNVTSKIITRDQWVKNFAPTNLRAVRFQNGYLALRDVADENTANSAFFVDPSELKVALTEYSEFSTTSMIETDPFSGEVLLLDGGKVLRWDPPVFAQQWPILWRSKEFQLQQQKNFGCYAIYWDEARFFDSPIGTSLLAHDVRVRFRVWADRRLVYDETVPFNGQGVRLPSGFGADIWQFEICARAPVYSLHVATTMRELKDV